MPSKHSARIRNQVHRMPGVLPGRLTPNTPSKTPKPYGRLAILLLIAGALAGVYWYVLLGPAFAIQNVEITDIQNDSLTAVANQLIGRNIFRLKDAAIEQEMKQA